MIRVKLLKKTKYGKQGEVIQVSRELGFNLVHQGRAIFTKDMTETDYKVTSDEEQADGNPTQLRAHN